ncbi:hypothetical protein ACFP6A_03605 [Quadrisphaera sp. GCM10027208]|uniref:hypothetical protein n=1 Tax=Quadrisphaera sp. GCM10027208 TaxID=3273423 RepID=UPI00360A35F2
MGGFDAFSVDLDALQDAGRGISDAVAEFGRTDVVDLLPSAAAVGHDGLSAALAEFDDRWERGVNHLLADTEEIGVRLAETVACYAETEAKVTERFLALDKTLTEGTGP